MSEIRETVTVNKDELMRKFDRESATRIWEGKPKVLITVLISLFSLYCIWSTLFSVAALEIRLTSFLGMVILVGYLSYPATKRHVRPNSMPWYDVVIMLAGSGSFFYYCTHYKVIARNITSSGKMTPFLILLGVVGIACLVELCRRCVGVPILCVAGVLLIYTFIYRMRTGNSIYASVAYIVHTLYISTNGVLATPVQVCAKFIAVFIIFGAFLERTGISNFFIDMANSLVGSASGGTAKVAVVSSALCGMVSGSSVGNTVTTGSVTIPMMKSTGYKPEFAGAVEAAASTGGQIMPPIMGAAAFLMAEYMGVRYGNVALWAILPAVLYFTGIFIAVHLEAKKLGLKGIPREQLPVFTKLIRRVYLLLPLVVLVWLVATNIRSLAYSASIAIVISILVVIPAELGKIVKKENGFSGMLKNLGTLIVSALEAGGRSCVTVVVACSMAGIVAGCITATGLASRLISGVLNVAALMPNQTLAVLVSLLLTMICCIILGMGVPTTANYCIMASTCAPILIEMGINKIAAHFFVFYFGIVADITPPVALAAYAGAAIAKSDPMRTGINATKLAIAAFVVPYVFAMNPSMLLMDQGALAAASVVVTSVLGIFAIAAALNGYVFKTLNPLEKLLFIAAGIMLLIPGMLTDIAGAALFAATLLMDRGAAKRAA